MAAGQWLSAAASRLGVAAKVKAVRSEAYFKRLAAAGKQQRPAASPPSYSSTAPGSSSSSSSTTPQGPLVLLAEPYYSEFEQLVPWAHLRFWRDADVIRGSAAAAGGGGGGGGRRRVVALPYRARLVGVAAALPELYRTRTALGGYRGQAGRRGPHSSGARSGGPREPKVGVCMQGVHMLQLCTQ